MWTWTGVITIRRSADLVRVKGEGGEITEGGTKTSKPRVIDVDPATVAVLRAWKAERGSLALALADKEPARHALARCLRVAGGRMDFSAMRSCGTSRMPCLSRSGTGSTAAMS